MNALLEALKTMAGTVGTVVDTPGSFGRGLAMLDPARAIEGISDPKRRVSARELSKQYPWLDALIPDEGAGRFVGEMGLSMATDPLMLALMLGPAVMGMTKLMPKMAPLGRAGLSPAPTAAKAAGWTRGGAAGAKAASVAKPAARVLTVKGSGLGAKATARMQAEAAERAASVAALARKAHAPLSAEVAANPRIAKYAAELKPVLVDPMAASQPEFSNAFRLLKAMEADKAVKTADMVLFRKELGRATFAGKTKAWYIGDQLSGLTSVSKARAMGGSGAAVAKAKAAAAPVTASPTASMAAEDAANLARITSQGASDVAATMQKLGPSIVPAKTEAVREMLSAFHEPIKVGSGRVIERMVERGGSQLTTHEVLNVAKTLGIRANSKSEALREMILRASDRLKNWQRTQF